MIQCGSGPCLLDKSLHAFFVGSDFSRQDFECYSSIELQITRQVHLTHAAFANFRAYFIAAEMFSAVYYQLKFTGELFGFFGRPRELLRVIFDSMPPKLMQIDW